MKGVINKMEDYYEDDLINFKEETIEKLKDNGKSMKDIRWIGRLEYYNEKTGEYEQFKYDIDEFFNKIDFRYDSGYGLVKIPLDLVIVGDDWWMERWEYDGAECWIFKCLPDEPENIVEMPERIKDSIG